MYETILLYLNEEFRGQRLVVTVPRVGDHWGFNDVGTQPVLLVQWRYDSVRPTSQGPNDPISRPTAHVFCGQKSPAHAAASPVGLT